MVHNTLSGFPIDDFQIGSRFAAIAGTTVCLNGKELENIRKKEFKSRIVNYLKHHSKIRISDISQDLDIAPRMVGMILRELEEEGIIREVD